MSEGTKNPIPPLILGIVTARMLRERRHPETLWECDGVELRADGLPSAEVLPAVEAFAAEKKRRNFAGPVVFTLRLRRDGGAWEETRAAEREPLWLAITAGNEPLCDIVDVEVEEIASLEAETRRKLFEGKSKVILSHHAFVPEDPASRESLFESMKTFHPDAVKFAVTVTNPEETASLLRFARKVGKQFPLSCVIAMGETGQTTRVLCPLMGCPITYAFLEDEPVAPGQLPLKVLRACFQNVADRPAPDAAEVEWIGWAERVIRESSVAG